MTDVAIVRVGGACALLGVAAALAGAAVGAIHGLGGQEIPLANAADFSSLVNKQAGYVAREWLFLAYPVLGIGEGVGLYYLTRSSRHLALWAVITFLAGILIAIVQDAAVVGFVRQFPAEYAAADAAARMTLEPLARSQMGIVSIQQTVANVLLGIGGALFSIAVLQSGAAPRWFGVAGLLAALAILFYAVVAASAPALAEYQSIAEHLFGLVVLWDLSAALVMLGVTGPS